MMSLEPYFLKDSIEVGLDEAGRGCLAGPVYAAAVILNPKNPIEGLNDSKQLNEKRREELEKEIRNKALEYSISYCNPREIEEHNILNASIKAMHRSLDALKTNFNHILVDGNRFRPYKEIAFRTMIKGDSRFQSIAAASILAKCNRDRYMKKLSLKFPQYLWDKNKGYPTIEHRIAIAKHGATSHHRKSFKLLPENQIKLF